MLRSSQLLAEVGMTIDGLLTDVNWETEVELIVSRPGDHADEKETSLNHPGCEGKVKHLLCGGKQVAKVLEERGVEVRIFSEERTKNVHRRL